MDDDSNGVVTFDELRANVLLDMTFAENQMPQFARTEGFDRDWIIAKDGPDRIRNSACVASI